MNGHPAPHAWPEVRLIGAGTDIARIATALTDTHDVKLDTGLQKPRANGDGKHRRTLVIRRKHTATPVGQP